jgi:hypothetical protein
MQPTILVAKEEGTLVNTLNKNLNQKRRIIFGIVLGSILATAAGTAYYLTRSTKPGPPALNGIVLNNSTDAKSISGVEVGVSPTYGNCPSGYETFPLTCTKGCGGYWSYSWGAWGCNGPQRNPAWGWGWNDCYQSWIVDCVNQPAHTINREPICGANQILHMGMCFDYFTAPLDRKSSILNYGNAVDGCSFSPSEPWIMEQFRPACNAHDICYRCVDTLKSAGLVDTSGFANAGLWCDAELIKNLFNQCSRLPMNAARSSCRYNVDWWNAMISPNGPFNFKMQEAYNSQRVKEYASGLHVPTMCMNDQQWKPMATRPYVFV